MSRHAMADRDGAVLLTGATGFVGTELLARFLEQTDRTVYVLVRADDARAARARVCDAVMNLSDAARGQLDRVVALPGDVTRPALGLAEVDRLAAEVTDVVHGAASVSFALGLEESRAINVEGTRRLLEFAALCERRGGLRSFSYISTAYVAGRHRGRFSERDLDVGQSFRNAYEQSKHEAEALVRSRRGELPISIFRPSIVVGDRRTGWTQSFNVLYGPLRAFAGDGYPALPLRRSSPVDVVSVDYVADAIFALSQAEGRGRTYHLTAGDEAATAGELVDLAAERFGRRVPVSVPPAAYRRLLHPLAVRLTSGRRRRMLRSTEVYFPYFDVDVHFEDSRTRAALAPLGVRPAQLPGYFDRLVDFAQRAEWGRRPITRRQALEAS